MNRMLSIACLALAMVAVAMPPPAIAQPAARSPAGEPPMSAEALAVQKAIVAKFPGAQVSYVGKTAYFGLFEAMLDDRLVYTDAKVNYVIVGSIYDANTKQDLTEDRHRKLSRIAWSDLPLNLAMKKVKGNGSRKMAVFSDADCPFCARLENEMKNLDNVTIYTFLFPIDQLHPDAARKSRMIWCAPDRQKAWDEFFVNGKLPENNGECANPIAETQVLGQKFRVNATPTLVFADGSMVPGAIPLARLEQELATAESEARKIAAQKK